MTRTFSTVRFAGILVGVLALFFGAQAAFTASAALFTQSELDENWVPDRSTPSGGYASVSAFSRDNVARISIDSDNPTAAPTDSSFFRTEGIKKAEDFGDEVKMDLYVDPAWRDKAVRAGLWVVTHDENSERTNWFGIIEFASTRTSNGVFEQDERWRIWSSATGWTDLDTKVRYGKWVTLEIEFDDEDDIYEYRIGKKLVGTALAGEVAANIGEVFLNSYNYGYEDVAPGLSNESYDVHWHADGDKRGGKWKRRGKNADDGDEERGKRGGGGSKDNDDDDRDEDNDDDGKWSGWRGWKNWR